MNDLLESARTSLTAITVASTFLLATGLLTGCGGPDDCAGCGPGPDPDPAPSSSCVAGEAPASATIVPGIVLPNGMGFSELSEGGGIPLQSGAQGGTHIDVGARAFVDPGPGATVEFEVESPDYGGSAMVTFQSCNGEWSQMVGRVFDPPSGDVMLRITVLDAGGAEIAMTEMATYVE